ncbi:MAG: endonuclease III [Phycisphaerae bacterium]
MGKTTTRETVDQRKARGGKILRVLKRLYPQADCALRHKSVLELMVSTVLSAQSTDEIVNKVTPALFRRYRTAADFAAADRAELEEIIHATGFFRQKAKNIQRACIILVERHGGQVPGTLEELVQLPGVARKTANVILGSWFKKNAGVVVDTHVGRLSERMGLTWRGRNSKDAVKIERDLMEIVPRRSWTYFGHAMIRHGRGVCTARKPACDRCKIANYCPSAGRFE